MTVRIMLACAGGFSTSMLMEKMKESAKKQGLDVTVDAIGEGRIEKVIDQIDVLLLGPQVSHLEASLKTKYADRNVPITVIAPIDYGMMNGEKVLKQAFDLLNK